MIKSLSRALVGICGLHFSVNVDDVSIWFKVVLFQGHGCYCFVHEFGQMTKNECKMDELPPTQHFVLSSSPNSDRNQFWGKLIPIGSCEYLHICYKTIERY
jgi:uncharacterized protein YegJ (DUF2314 family)